MKNSAIEWTDHTFNPWIGCTKVSPGCANCYAEAQNSRFAGGKNWGPGAPRWLTSATNWLQPLRWDHAAAWHERDAEASDRAPPRRQRVFCASLADWLDYEVPTAWRVELLALIEATPHLDWLLLSKRPESWNARMHEAMGAGSKLAHAWLNGTAPANVWVGTSVEDQARADERIPELLTIPARVRFLSCEPLLGYVYLNIDGLWKHTCETEAKSYIDSADDGQSHPAICRDQADRWMEARAEAKNVDWVIVGGESGHRARPMRPEWARSLRDQCAAAGVPFFFKQWGTYAPTADVEGFMYRAGKKAAGRLLDGREHNEFPRA